MKKIPAHLNAEYINEWVPEESTILRETTDLNTINGDYCVAYIYDDTFTFARFFLVGDKTHVSVDFQSNNYAEMTEKIIDLLEDKFTF